MPSAANATSGTVSRMTSRLAIVMIHVRPGRCPGRRDPAHALTVLREELREAACFLGKTLAVPVSGAARSGARESLRWFGLSRGRSGAPGGRLLDPALALDDGDVPIDRHVGQA